MEEIIIDSFANNKVVMNLLFLATFEVIIAILSFKVLEKYSWKETFLANFIITFGVAIIKLHGMNFFKIFATVVVQTITTVAAHVYMYDKCDDLKEYMPKCSFLSIVLFCRRGCVLYTLEYF